jgi:hypothetical protein
LGDFATPHMKDELLSVLSKVATTQLALESLRDKDTARALELLEVDLDASVIALARLSKEVAPADRERVTTTLRQIRAHRRIHPRRAEADLSSLASGLLSRAAHQGGERAHEILEEIGD